MKESSADRILCGMPVRWTTLMFWPEEITLEEFTEKIRSTTDGWEETLKRLGNHSGKMFAEQWAQSLLGFMEIEIGDPNERTSY